MEYELNEKTVAFFKEEVSEDAVMTPIDYDKAYEVHTFEQNLADDELLVQLKGVNMVPPYVGISAKKLNVFYTATRGFVQKIAPMVSEVVVDEHGKERLRVYPTNHPLISNPIILN